MVKRKSIAHNILCVAFGSLVDDLWSSSQLKGQKKFYIKFLNSEFVPRSDLTCISGRHDDRDERSSSSGT